jgi:hypothetical protein
LYNVAERLTGRQTPKRTGLPFAQIVLNPAFERFAEEQPRLKHRPRHHGYFAEFLVRVLWTISATQRGDQSNDFSTALQSGASQGSRHDIGDEGIARDEYVSARDKNGDQSSSPAREKLVEPAEIGFRQHREPRQRGALVTVKRGRNAPYPTSSISKFRLFLGAIFHQPIRWISHDRVDAVGRAPREPLNRITQN